MKAFFFRLFFFLFFVGLVPASILIYFLFFESNLLAYFIGGGTIIFILLLSLVLSRKIFIPLDNIIKGVQKFKGGDFTTRINVRKSKGAEELAEAFNDMADLTKEVLSKKKDIDKIIEERVKEKIEELDEKIKKTETVLSEAQEKNPKEIEKILEKERERSSRIIKNLTDGLIILDEKGKILEVNPKSEKMLLIKAKDVEGKMLDEMKQAPSLAGVINILFEGQNIKEVKREEFSPQDNVVLELTSVLVEIEDKNKGYLLIFHDISREKLIQNLKTEFVSLSAHQLRTPLSGIKWTLKMILDGDMGELQEGQKEFLQKIYQNNERMIKLINDLLDVTKIEEGKYLYYSREGNIIDALEIVMPPLKEKAIQKGLKFELQKPKEKIPKMKIDREKIEICMHNLIDNAIKYTERGEVKVSLEHDKKNKKAIFSVKDTGIGIPQSQQKRVFTKFFRATKEHLKSEVEAVGSGLGLYITKNIIDAHGGEIWFESKEGEGSTFYFSLSIKKGTKNKKDES